MGAKAKKAMKKTLSKATSLSSNKKEESADFLVCMFFPLFITPFDSDFCSYSSVFCSLCFKPLEGGPGRKLPAQKPLESTATVLYIGRIPQGFFEKEMEGLASHIHS